MTPDEHNLLTRFLDDLNGVKGVQKDPEAAAQITQALAANPDAPYLLVQHAILADQALATAQARIAELESEVRRQYAQGQTTPQQGGGFLGGLFGGGQREPEPQPIRRGPWGGPQPMMVTPQMQPQQGGFFGGGAPAQPGGMGSFLRSAGTTAAGIAGGAFLFQGLSNLFGSHHGGQGFLGGGGFGGDEFGGGSAGGYGGAFDPSFDRATSNFADTSLDQGVGSGGDVSYDSDNGDTGGDDYS